MSPLLSPALGSGGCGAARGESGGHRDPRRAGSAALPGAELPLPCPARGAAGPALSPAPPGGRCGWMRGERRRGRAGLGRLPPPGLPAARSPRQGKAGKGGAAVPVQEYPCTVPLFSGRDAGPEGDGGGAMPQGLSIPVRTARFKLGLCRSSVPPGKAKPESLGEGGIPNGMLRWAENRRGELLSQGR